MSRGTLSKFITIHSNRDRFEAHRDALSGNWTTMYGFATLPEQLFNELASTGMLRLGLTENPIEPGTAPVQDCLPARIVFPALLSAEREDAIRRKVIEAVQDEVDVHIKFSNRRKFKASQK